MIKLSYVFRDGKHRYNLNNVGLSILDANPTVFAIWTPDFEDLGSDNIGGADALKQCLQYVADRPNFADVKSMIEVILNTVEHD